MHSIIWGHKTTARTHRLVGLRQGVVEPGVIARVARLSLEQGTSHRLTWYSDTLPTPWILSSMKALQPQGPEIAMAPGTLFKFQL